MVPSLEDYLGRGQLSSVSIQAFKPTAFQEPDQWEPEADDEAGTGQDEEVGLRFKSLLTLQQMEGDQTRDAIALAPAADGQEVGIEAQCCYKIIPGFSSLGTIRKQGGC